MRIILLITLLAIGGTSAARVRRLLSGVPISMGKAAFIVSIRFNEMHICSGSLISEDLVLTTEHCVRKEQQEHFGLSVVLAKDLNKANADTRKVLSVRVHPTDEGQSTRDVNIAILVLSRSIPLNENVRTIPLPVEDFLAARGFKSRPSLSAQLIGIKTYWIPIIRDDLTQLEVSVKRCKHAELLCGKSLVGGITSVDEGSPLVYSGTIIGIALDRKSEDGKYDIYAGVYKYREFIFNLMNDRRNGNF